MPYQKLEYSYRIFKNFIEIIPSEGMKDNSIYEIKIKGLKSASSQEEIQLDTIKFVTAITPSYCELIDVESLLDIVEIPPELIMYNIKEASRYADYIYKSANGIDININNIPFEVKEFTRYKAAKDCLLKIYMSIASNKMSEGTLGEVKFKVKESTPDLKNIIEYLNQEILKWQDAIKGYDLEGRAKMATAIKAINFNSTTKTAKSNGLTNIDLKLSRRGNYE